MLLSLLLVWPVVASAIITSLPPIHEGQFQACAAHKPTSGAHKGEDLTQQYTWSGGLSIPLNVPTARYEVGRLLRLPHFFAAGAKFLPPAAPAVSLQFSSISNNSPQLAPSKVLAWILHIQSYLHRWGQSTQRTHGYLAEPKCWNSYII